MRSIVAVLIFLASIPSVSGQERLDVKGIGFGAAETEITSLFRTAYCSTPTKPLVSDRMCIVPDITYGGAPATIVYGLIENKVIRIGILLKPADFDGVSKAMIERFGMPTKEGTETITNRMGAAFENILRTWIKDDVIIRARKYADRIDRSTIDFTQKSTMEEKIIPRMMQDRIDRSKDL